MILRSNDKEQENRVEDALQKQQGLTVKDTKQHQPQLAIKGVEKGHKKEDIIDELLRQNKDIRHTLTDDNLKNTRVIAIKDTRNPYKENIIIETDPVTFRYLIRKERATLDLINVYFEEHIEVAICFKCCRFGHVAKYCKEDPACRKCGGSHQGNQCAEETLNCINCQRMGLQERQHSATDARCPMLIRKREIARSAVNY